MWSYSENIWPNAQRGQMRAHLTNFVRIWSLLVGLTKCAAHLGKRAAQLAKCARNWPNTRAIYQTLRIWSNAARLTNWSNALFMT